MEPLLCGSLKYYNNVRKDFCVFYHFKVSEHSFVLKTSRSACSVLALNQVPKFQWCLKINTMVKT